MSATALLLLLAVAPPNAGAVPQPDTSAAFVQSVVGAPRGATLAGDTLDRRTEELSHEIRCPVCQGSTIGDSPSPTARNMKQQVKEMLGEGYNDEQVLAYFEASYGEFVRLAPRTQGFTVLVWVLPVVLLFAGAIVVAVFLGRRRVAALPLPAADDSAGNDPVLDPWLRRVRAMVDDGAAGDAR